VGLLWWAAGGWGTRVWGPAAGAALVLAGDLLVTGGLHVDGLADQADGVASRLPADRALAIMREGPVGAVGAAAAGVALLLRFALLAAVLGGTEPSRMVAAPVAGRLAMVLVLAWGRAPPGPSLSEGMRRAARGMPLAVAAGSALVASAAFAGVAGVAAVASGCLAALGNGAWASRRFGGVTGDVLGAGGLLAETVALGVLAA
jgi:adenosylcobinamide-GDP ribazoletransferase